MRSWKFSHHDNTTKYHDYHNNGVYPYPWSTPKQHFIVRIENYLFYNQVEMYVPCRGSVTDILLWVECYSTLVAVLASQYLTKVPQMMAYQKTIAVWKLTKHLLGKDGWHMTHATVWGQLINYAWIGTWWILPYIMRLLQEELRSFQDVTTA